MIKYKYLIQRRVLQILILCLYILANIWGVNILIGNLSTSVFLEEIPLSDPYAVLQMFFSGAVIASDIFIGALIVVIFYALIGGRVFCSWVCPMNIVSDFSNFLRRKLKFNQIQKKQPASRTIRYWVLGLSLILSFILAVPAFEFLSPISILHRGIIFGMGLGWAAVLIIFLFDLFVLKNGWCGYICPLGAFYSLIGKYSLVRVEHNESKCTLCMKCKEICPENQVLFMIGKSSEQVLSGECTNCARCVEVCNDDALNFSIRNLIKQKNKGK